MSSVASVAVRKFLDPDSVCDVDDKITLGKVSRSTPSATIAQVLCALCTLLVLVKFVESLIALNHVDQLSGIFTPRNVVELTMFHHQGLRATWREESIVLSVNYAVFECNDSRHLSGHLVLYVFISGEVLIY